MRRAWFKCESVVDREEPRFRKPARRNVGATWILFRPTPLARVIAPRPPFRPFLGPPWRGRAPFRIARPSFATVNDSSRCLADEVRRSYRFFFRFFGIGTNRPKFFSILRFCAGEGFAGGGIWLVSLSTEDQCWSNRFARIRCFGFRVVVKDIGQELNAWHLIRLL